MYTLIILFFVALILAIFFYFKKIKTNAEVIEFDDEPDMEELTVGSGRGGGGSGGMARGGGSIGSGMARGGGSIGSSRGGGGMARGGGSIGSGRGGTGMARGGGSGMSRGGGQIGSGRGGSGMARGGGSIGRGNWWGRSPIRNRRTYYNYNSYYPYSYYYPFYSYYPYPYYNYYDYDYDYDYPGYRYNVTPAVQKFSVRIMDKENTHPYNGRGSRKGFSIIGDVGGNCGVSGATLNLQKGVTYEFDIFTSRDCVTGEYINEPFFFTTDPEGGSELKNVFNVKPIVNGVLRITPDDTTPSRFFYNSSKGRFVGGNVVIVN
jgi:hypothetical protein